MGEPSDWAKAKAKELCTMCRGNHPLIATITPGVCHAYILRALEEAAQRERWECHRVADLGGQASLVAHDIAARGQMVAP
jgi:hypothetical protein